MRYNEDEGREEMKLQRPEYIEMERQSRHAFMISAHEASAEKTWQPILNGLKASAVGVER